MEKILTKEEVREVGYGYERFEELKATALSLYQRAEDAENRGLTAHMDGEMEGQEAMERKQKALFKKKTTTLLDEVAARVIKLKVKGISDKDKAIGKYDFESGQNEGISEALSVIEAIKEEVGE